MDLPHPDDPLSYFDKLTYGEDAERHGALGFIIQRGMGCSSVEGQEREYLSQVAASEGESVAAELRNKLQAWKAAGGAVKRPPPAANVSRSPGP